jgi:hypothetical protein
MKKPPQPTKKLLVDKNEAPKRMAPSKPELRGRVQRVGTKKK